MKYLRDEALTELSGELAMLLHAGLDIAGGLAMLAEDREGPDGELLTALRRDAEEGLPLSECMERSSAFPPEVCAQVRCGERTGRLEETLSAILTGVEQLAAQSRQLVIVSNEVFSGGLDYAGDTGRYLRLLAEVNRKLAARAHRVCEVVCGIPQEHKGAWQEYVVF